MSSSMAEKCTTDVIFALRVLMEKLSCTVFVDLEKPYDTMPREELWYYTRMLGVAVKYVRVMQDMY